MIAPYSETTISVSLGSVTGLRYRTLNCMECGQPFMERNSDKMFRLGNKDLTEEAKPDSGGSIATTCGNCLQKYTVTISTAAQITSTMIPLHMQPQTLFITNEPVKKLRDTFCLECGKAFYSISDRIKLLMDSVTPIELIGVGRLGPMESRCKFQHCKQRWYIRV